MCSNAEFTREMSYDLEHLSFYVTKMEPCLTDEQKQVYENVLSSVNGQAKLFFLDAPGGTGKTFLINSLLAKVRKDSKIGLATASSGIAATLLPGGRRLIPHLKFLSMSTLWKLKFAPFQGTVLRLIHYGR